MTASPVYNLEETPTIYEVFQSPRPREIGQPVEVTKEVFQYFLNLLPPAYCSGGFMVIEPDCHTQAGAVHSKFTTQSGRYYHEWALVNQRL